MHDPATLELNIRSWPGESHTIEPRYYAPGSETGQRPYLGSDSPLFPLDLAKLREAWADPVSYGQTLASMVFHDRRIGEALATARARAAAAEVPLRLRLRLDPADP